MYDSGAALTVGYLVFHPNVAKNYPFLVKTIWSNQDKNCSPIRLCSVVNNNNGNNKAKNRVTCELPVVIE